MPVSWTTLDTLKLSPGPFDAPWHLLVEMIDDFDHLKIIANGGWIAVPGLTVDCGPNGIAGLELDPKALVVDGCRLGALIGKFGGSSSRLETVTVADAAATPTSTAFGIGGYCVHALPTDFRGPLFIGFNVRHRPITITSLDVTVQGAKLK